MRIEDLTRRAAQLWPEAPAVDDGQRRRSFAQLDRRSRALARAFAELGLERGERIAVISTNRAEFVEAYFAAASLGVVLVPLNWRLRAGEWSTLVQDATARAVLAEDRFFAAIEEVRAQCPLVRHWIGLGAIAPGWSNLESLLAKTLQSEDVAPQPTRQACAEVAIQMYTSGTTGLPKGAMLTHGNVTSLVAAWVEELALGAAPDCFLQVTPLFHVGGMLQVMSTVASGAKLLLLPEFAAAPALECLTSKNVTHALFVPAMLQWLLAEKNLQQRRFPALRMIIYGASPIQPRVLEQAMVVFGCEFLQGYGLTETAGVVTTLRPRDHALAVQGVHPERLQSAGRALACCKLRVVDPEGNDQAPMQIGEVWVQGPQVGPGYWMRPEATAAEFQGGWFRTGDLGTLDSEGYLTIVDRLKDMLLVAGENVYPSEIEARLCTHPGVADAAVIGIPHEHWGEEVLALVVPAASANTTGNGLPDPRQLIQHCRTHLARFKCPTRVEFREHLPRNAAGKLLKRELRDPYWRGQARKV